MPTAESVLIHHFDGASEPYFDDDGDQMLDYYFQMIGIGDLPISGLIGPYRSKGAVEKAAKRAFRSKDF